MLEHVRKKELFAGLKTLAEHLNALQENFFEMDVEVRSAWIKARCVVSSAQSGTLQSSRWTKVQGKDSTRELEYAAAYFHREISPKGPVCLQIAVQHERKKTGGRVNVSLIHAVPRVLDSNNPYANAAVLLWHYFFHPDGYWRLKLCRKCSRWFCDQGKTRKARFCSRPCADSWWTRGRRKLGRNAFEREVQEQATAGERRVLDYLKSIPNMDEAQERMIQHLTEKLGLEC